MAHHWWTVFFTSRLFLYRTEFIEFFWNSTRCPNFSHQNFSSVIQLLCFNILALHVFLSPSTNVSYIKITLDFIGMSSLFDYHFRHRFQRVQIQKQIQNTNWLCVFVSAYHSHNCSWRLQLSKCQSAINNCWTWRYESLMPHPYPLDVWQRGLILRGKSSISKFHIHVHYVH